MIRGWIPMVPLALGALASGISWVVLFCVARAGTFGLSFRGLAWLHLVALGWLTLVALSVLVHALPEFSDVSWRSARVVRWSILVYALGVFGLLSGFLANDPIALQIGATIAALALVVYIALAIATLTQALGGEPVERAIARAFMLTLSCLFLTAVLGTIFAYAIGGHFPAGALVELPRVHAVLGIGGWLTLLVMGVSARTLRPITGVRTRKPALHIAGSSCVALGTLGTAAALTYASLPLTIVGLALALLGTILYAADVIDIVARATVPHRAPHVLMISGACFAVGTAILAICAARGFDTGSAAVYAALIGWIGSAVIAHFHHIGVRVMLTATRGDDDETRPWQVLVAPLTWLCVAFYTFAALAGVIALVLQFPALLEVAAASGLLSFMTMASNMIFARRNARRLPIVL